MKEKLKGWKQISFGDLCTDIYRYPTYYNIEYVEEGIPEIRGEMLRENGKIDNKKENIRYISVETAKRFPRTTVRAGDIVMSVRGTVGKIGLVSKEFEGANITANLLKITPKRDIVDPNFFKQYLLSNIFQTALESITTSTTIKTLKVPQLKEINCLIPPLPEQKKIAEILTTVDEHIEQTEQLIKKTKELKKGLMQKLLTKGIGHTRFKKTEVGEIPEEWEVIPLIDTGEYINGRAFKPFEWKEHGIPIIRIQNLTDPNASFNYYEGDIESKYIVQYGDLLFAWSGSIGLHIWRGNTAYLNQHIYKVIPRQNIDKMFLYYQLSRQIEIFLDLSHGTTMKHITRKNLELVKIALPSYNEQVRIANILSEIDNQLHFYESQKQQLQQLKKGLMQKLLTGKIRVKV